MYTNMDSYVNKRMKLKLFLSSLPTLPSIIAITEVNPKNYSEAVIESELVLDGYQLFCVHLSEKNYRGVLIYVKNNISACQIDIESTFEEYIVVKIRSESQELLVCCIYRSPNSTVENDKKMLDIG